MAWSHFYKSTSANISTSSSIYILIDMSGIEIIEGWIFMGGGVFFFFTSFYFIFLNIYE